MLKIRVENTSSTVTGKEEKMRLLILIVAFVTNPYISLQFQLGKIIPIGPMNPKGWQFCGDYFLSSPLDTATEENKLQFAIGGPFGGGLLAMPRTKIKTSLDERQVIPLAHLIIKKKVGGLSSVSQRQGPIVTFKTEDIKSVLIVLNNEEYQKSRCLH